MRIFSPSLTLGAVLIAGLSAGALVAQDQSQPAAGAPPATSSQGQAESQSQHVPDPHRMAKRMTKKLGLSQDQEAKLEPILAEREQQMQSARADTTLAPADKHAKMKDINQSSDSQIEALLTDSQRQQYEQMKANRRAEHQQQTSAPPSN